ncbi:30S ribosomal protein S1 [Elioraea sp. Yellowstone]|uniref:30S ribosomal protein S1 n=1 Tax=Elioraea sp. Yellowstone TaxID=2592070 RepID=UPI00272CC360|nr:30S ribosomal protein S1 [Elioraea sp. Yellowstone]
MPRPPSRRHWRRSNGVSPRADLGRVRNRLTLRRSGRSWDANGRCGRQAAPARDHQSARAVPGKPCPAPPSRRPVPGAQTAVARSRRQEDTHRMANTATVPVATEDFAALLDATLGSDSGFDGSVITGRVVRIEGDAAVIDVGLKSEGRVPLKEFAAPGQKPEIKPGDLVDVYVERYEDRDGSIILSREKARREEAWTNLEKAFQAGSRVNGVIFGRVKGGFTVDLGGAVAFLPGSQVDIRPVRDVGPLMGTPQPFQILKMDRSRGNIVVSRRAVLEETRAEQRAELVQGLKEGQILEGVVKNITDYGAFVDLGGVDGLLHVTDIAWRRINHPSEALQVGQTVKVQVIRFNPETQRISLGMKQLMADPWDGVTAKYPVGAKFTGRVTNITDYGAFVELEPGVEGLVHVSEMSWTKKNVHPGKIVSTSQEVEVMVLDVDGVKRRISLGLKQCLRNPWEEFLEKHPVGSTIKGEVKNITEFGLFIGLPGDIDGMVHLSDLAWDEPGETAIQRYAKGDVVEAKVLDVDVEKERISLGIKQLTSDPAAGVLDRLQKGQVVTCVVTAVQPNGIEVKVDDAVTGFIRKADLARDKQDQRPDRFGVGDKVDAKIIAIERASRRLSLSIKAREMEEEKQAMAEFGSSDSGASLGDILGAAIRRRNQMASEGKE